MKSKDLARMTVQLVAGVGTVCQRMISSLEVLRSSVADVNVQHFEDMLADMVGHFRRVLNLTGVLELYDRQAVDRYLELFKTKKFAAWKGVPKLRALWDRVVEFNGPGQLESMMRNSTACMPISHYFDKAHART